MEAGASRGEHGGYLATHQYEKQSPDELFWHTLGKTERDQRINLFKVDIDTKGQATIREMVMVIDGGLFPHLKTHFAEGVRILPNGEMLPPVVQPVSTSMKHVLPVKMGAR